MRRVGVRVGSERMQRRSMGCAGQPRRTDSVDKKGKEGEVEREEDGGEGKIGEMDTEVQTCQQKRFDGR